MTIFNVNQRIEINFDNIIKNQKSQASNFILDFTNSSLDYQSIIKQITNIYNSKGRNWINKFLIIKNNKLLMIIERN